MCREYTLNDLNRKSPISGGRNAPLKLTGSKMHGIRRMSRENFRALPTHKIGQELEYAPKR